MRNILRGGLKMKVTIYDVAEKAGVSIATVSKVLNNTGSMRETTRKRVLSIMEEMNYYPSMMASALTGKSTKTIGLLVPDISNPFFSEMARTIEDRAHESGMSVIMCSTDENIEKEKKYLALLQQKQVDGFIIASTFKDTELLKALIARKTPVIFLTMDDSSFDVSKVTVDDFQGGFEATNKLLELGHKNVAILAEHAHSSRMRIYGYREAHESIDLPIHEENITRTVATIENGKKYFDHFYDRKDLERPSAIFACNDLLAIGLIHRAKERDLSVPEDMSIIGFDDTILATISVPGLTTVAQPIAEMSNKCVDMLIQEIHDGKTLNERHLFNPELIMRGTTLEYKEGLK